MVWIQLEGPLELSSHLVNQIQRAEWAGEFGESTERSCQFDMGFWNLRIDGDSRAGVLRRLKVASTSFRTHPGYRQGSR